MMVFLGGTCNNSTWRDEIIPKLKIDYFNPVVEDWNDAAVQNEMKQKEIADFLLYVITPKMTGSYAIAEVVDSSNKNPDKTIFCVIREDGGERFSDAQWRSLSRVTQLISSNGAITLGGLDEVVDYLNRNK